MKEEEGCGALQLMAADLYTVHVRVVYLCLLPLSFPSPLSPPLSAPLPFLLHSRRADDEFIGASRAEYPMHRPQPNAPAAFCPKGKHGKRTLVQLRSTIPKRTFCLRLAPPFLLVAQLSPSRG